MRQDRGGVDTDRTGQPFDLKGVGEQDSDEWTHNVCAFMLARFGDQTLSALTWAARQRKIVVKTYGSSQRDRLIPWTDVFGEGAERLGSSGDDCTASTTPRRPCDAWRSFSRFKTHHVVSELRIWDLRWRIGSQRNLNTRCSPTATDDLARHQTTALWRRCSG